MNMYMPATGKAVQLLERAKTFYRITVPSDGLHDATRVRFVPVLKKIPPSPL